jgi:hypothetical protein
MANAKRAANRKASFRTGSSGSPYHTERKGAGPVAGAGEVYTGGPGKAARGYSGYARNDPRPAASGEAPKGMKTIASGDDY